MGDLFYEGMVLHLCSAWNPDHSVTCDLPRDHKGEHKATVYWKDSDSGE